MGAFGDVIKQQQEIVGRSLRKVRPKIYSKFGTLVLLFFKNLPNLCLYCLLYVCSFFERILRQSVK